MKKIDKLSCWIVTEGMAGTENQCIGVANSLGVEAKIIKSGLKQPWAIFSPWLGMESARIFDVNFYPPWPDLLITSGRKAVAVSRYIKKQSTGKTFTLHIQDPRVPPAQFDMVAVPYHDPARGSNVLVTDTAPNKINDHVLSQAALGFSQFKAFSSPRVAVVIGGKSKAYDMTEEMITGLISKLKKLQADMGCSLLITASRRTGEENMKSLKLAFPNDEKTYFWDGQGDNPYIAFLAYADFILVTADSVSMISDALATGKPTYVIPLKGGARRINIFHQHILEKGYVRIFDGILQKYEYSPVRAADIIAKEICKKMGVSSE